jgi:mono/diheme cytochrome c family protein
MHRLIVSLSFCAAIGCSTSGEPGDSARLQPASAENIYRQKCALCHGNDGAAGIAGATDLSKSTLSPEERVAVIAAGRGNMMPFRELLSTEEMVSVANYLDKLRTP